MFGNIRAISNVTRFGQVARLCPENVAEHSYWVCLFSCLIAEHLEREDSFQIDWRNLTLSSILHDMEESITGDFPRPFKHSSRELNEAIEKAATIAAKEVACDLSEDQLIRCLLFNRWREAKDKSNEGRIVALADYLSVLQWGLREKALGSRKISADLSALQEYVNQFEHESFAFLNDFVGQAKALTREVLRGD
jgi:5'-deoxynucleotidase YfbR-like HD superfamily hydrolase